jgi:PAS domain S-box-containing protein
MNASTKPGFRHAFWYGLFGFAFGLVFVIAATLIVLVRSGAPFSLPAAVQANQSDALLLLIDSLPFIFAVLFGWLGRREDRHLARQGELTVTTRSQAGELERQAGEIARLNEEMARQAEESRQAQAVVERGKREWQATFDSVADLIVLTDAGGRIIRCNRAAAQAFQAGYDQLLGMQIDELFFGSAASGVSQFPAERAELQFPQLDGWYEVLSHPLALQGDQPGKVYLVRNISDRKQASLSLDRQRQYYEVLVRDNPLAIATLNLELRLVDCNPAFERLFGYSKQELFGKPLDDIVLPEGEQAQGQALSRAVLAGETVSQVASRRLRDGGQVRVQVFGMPVVLWGRQIGVLAMYNDLRHLQEPQPFAPAPEPAAEWLPEEPVEEAPVAAQGPLEEMAAGPAGEEPAAPGEAALAAEAAAMEAPPPAEAMQAAAWENEGGAVSPEELAAASAATQAGPMPEEAPPVEEAPPPAEAPAHEEARAGPARRRLQVEAIEGIGPVYAGRLAAQGITTTEQLLRAGANPRGRQQLVDQTGIPYDLILKWVNRADLMRVPGVGEEYSDLLEAAGVDTVRELRHRDPANLHLALEETNARKKLVRRLPHLSEVQAWVAAAQEMETVLTY